MNIIRDQAVSRIDNGTIPSQKAVIEFEEICRLCNRPLEDGRRCYRHTKTDNIICTDCAVDIAVAR